MKMLNKMGLERASLNIIMAIDDRPIAKRKWWKFQFVFQDQAQDKDDHSHHYDSTWYWKF